MWCPWKQVSQTSSFRELLGEGPLLCALRFITTFSLRPPLPWATSSWGLCDKDIEQTSFWETWDSSSDQLWFEGSLKLWQIFITLHSGLCHFFPLPLYTNHKSIRIWHLSQLSQLPLHFSLTGIPRNKNCTFNSTLESPSWRTCINTLLLYDILCNAEGKPRATFQDIPFLCAFRIKFTYKSLAGHLEGFPGGSDGKESACSAGDLRSILESGRSIGEGNGNKLQCSYLENHMDRGTWQATVHGVTKSWTWLSNSHTHTHTHMTFTRQNGGEIIVLWGSLWATVVVSLISLWVISSLQ